jgi:hypothetical protein
VARSALAALGGGVSRAGARLAAGRGATDRAQPRRCVSLVLESPLEAAVAVPGARHLEADPGAPHELDEPGAVAVLDEPPLEVPGEAEVVAGVPVRAGEVEQVFGRQAVYADLILDAGAGRRGSGDWVGINRPLGARGGIELTSSDHAAIAGERAYRRIAR